jgi:hypothetical protein
MDGFAVPVGLTAHGRPRKAPALELARGSSTRARTTALGSPIWSSDSFSYLTAGTSTWMSIPKGGCACGPGGGR